MSSAGTGRGHGPAALGPRVSVQDASSSHRSGRLVRALPAAGTTLPVRPAAHKSTRRPAKQRSPGVAGSPRPLSCAAVGRPGTDGTAGRCQPWGAPFPGGELPPQTRPTSPTGGRPLRPEDEEGDAGRNSGKRGRLGAICSGRPAPRAGPGTWGSYNMADTGDLPEVVNRRADALKTITLRAQSAAKFAAEARDLRSALFSISLQLISDSRSFTRLMNPEKDANGDQMRKTTLRRSRQERPRVKIEEGEGGGAPKGAPDLGWLLFRPSTRSAAGVRTWRTHPEAPERGSQMLVRLRVSP